MEATQTHITLHYPSHTHHYYYYTHLHSAINIHTIAFNTYHTLSTYITHTHTHTLSHTTSKCIHATHYFTHTHLFGTSWLHVWPTLLLATVKTQSCDAHTLHTPLSSEYNSLFCWKRGRALMAFCRDVTPLWCCFYKWHNCCMEI